MPEQARSKPDIAGSRYGRLTAIREIGRNKWNKLEWEFRCDCGKTVVRDASAVKCGNTSSCGCLHRDGLRLRMTVHGMKRHELYTVWQNMKERCRNPRTRHYHRYGGRGIRVCQRWLRSFANFVTDMGPRPSPAHSLDRINNNGDYTPENCRWATAIQQCRNTRRNVVLEFQGLSMTVPEWAEETGISASVIRGRIKNGWTAERALSVVIDGRTARWK